MRKTLILLAILLVVNCEFEFSDIKFVESSERCKGPSDEWKSKEYYLPEEFVVQGSASGYLPVERLIINLTVESKQDEAASTLRINNNKIGTLMRDLIRMGLKQEDITTSDLQIYPTYNKVFDEEKQQYKQAIEWIVIKNKVTITTKKIELAGKIIDTAISKGIDQVDSVSFSPMSDNIKKLKEKLIVEAVEDAQRRALLALDPINYEIVSVKNVEIDSYRQPLERRYSKIYGQAGGADSNSSTNIYSSDQNFQTSVSVSFIIRSKTQKFTRKNKD